MEAFSGYVAGACGIFVTHPLDTVRTRLQISRGSKSAFEIAKTIIHQRGPSGLFAGVVPPVFFRGLSFGINREVFGRCQDLGFSCAFSGMLAGLAMSAADSPVHLVKCRSQVASSKLVKESVGAYFTMMRNIASKEGFTGLYSGISFLLVINSLSYAAFYTTYDTLRTNHVSPFNAGVVSALVSWVPIYPIDVLRCRIMSVTKETTFAKQKFTNAYFLNEMRQSGRMWNGLKSHHDPSYPSLWNHNGSAGDD